MKQGQDDRPLQEALADCLRALEGGQSLEGCLERYPQWAAELRPLLAAAAALWELGRQEPPAPAWQEARQRFLQRASLLQRPRARPGWPWPLKAGALAASLLLALSLAGGATIFAADSSLPDSPLYPVKLTVERARLRFAFSDEARARLLLAHAERRLGEMESTEARGRPIRGLAVAALEEHTEEAVALLAERPQPPELQAEAERVWARQGDLVARLWSHTDPEDRPQLLRAFLAAHRSRLDLRERPRAPLMAPPMPGGEAAPMVRPPMAGGAVVVRLRGPLSRDEAGAWTVGGARPMVDEATILDSDALREGQQVVVIALRLADGRLKALVVKPARRPAGPTGPPGPKPGRGPPPRP